MPAPLIDRLVSSIIPKIPKGFPVEIETRKKTKVYLAGPMNGYPEHNHPTFHEAARQLRANGFEVVNPAEINPLGNGRDFIECLRHDISAMVLCDAVVFLPGYEHSKGARIEASIAETLEINMLRIESILPDYK